MTSYLAKCGSCGASNRIPAEKEGVAGHCGNCRADLPPLYVRPQQVSDGDFDTFVSRYSGPILAEFWAPW